MGLCNMLQIGHDGYRSVPNSIAKDRQEYQRSPVMPVLVGEVNYEGILHSNEAEVQRQSQSNLNLKTGWLY